MTSESRTPALLFEALIVPHRSLSPRGRCILLSAIGLLSGLTVVRFWLIGAWPVAAFSGAELALAGFLLGLNARRARASELVLLSEERLRVVRTDRRGGREEQTMPASWMKVVLEDRPGRVSALVLTHRGRRLEIGAFLGEDEKRDLAQTLRDALDRWRNPRFENPQLAGPEPRSAYGSPGPIDLMSSNTRLRIDGSVMR